ncbi:phosphate transporter [Lepidopterella palustris CBS 459.81]|uniref:Phosphate transporter n=1 Tax=Lepidopterella palustris CBS 459.81 TaxID=1314670 RepID=A0A8E2E503_9PEZI|nr:phosphate transporter [Lepidopterella palustris CBS 459.81]
MALHQYDYLFAIGTMFAFLDAWNIGANNVANSLATSVSSRSLTMKQAMFIATCMEFAGSMAVGARLFAEEPAVLMLGMVCVVVRSSLYLTVATKFGLPVSTTHSIMGGWTGVSQVFAAWVIASGIAGAFGAIVFLVTKYGVMRRKNPNRKAFITFLIYFAFTSGLLTMLIVWKGASPKIKLSDSEIAGVIVGVALGVALLAYIFFLPYLYGKLVINDWQLRWWHMPQDYYQGHLTREELEAKRTREMNPENVEKHPNISTAITTSASFSNVIEAERSQITSQTADSPDCTRGNPPPDSWFLPSVIFYWVRKGFFHGVEDVISAQGKRNMLSGDLEELHARASHFDNKAEHMYSFLQVMTAATSSFTHGANDVSNAIGPYASIYLIWHTARLSDNTYGYNIMRNLGNRLTLHSPSHGFSMELGSAITVIMATRLKLPTSTTQCITGATVGVGLCNGDWRTINWRMVAWIYMG